VKWNGGSPQVRMNAMRAWLVFAFLVLAVPPMAAQSLLPARFAGWQTVPGSASTVPLNQLPPAQAALLRDCHAQQTVEKRSYRRGDAQIDVSLYWMGDPSWAYSAYSVLRPMSTTSFRPTPHSSIGNDRAMMLVGNMLVDVTGKNLAGDKKDFVALAKALEPHASQQPYPTLWQYLPTERFVPHSDRYALNMQTLQTALRGTEMTGRAEGAKPAFAWPQGDWLGFNDEVEAESALYQVRGRKLMLLLASYPTPQLATEHMKEMARWFLINPKEEAKAGAKSGRPVLYARKMGSIVGFVAGAHEAGAAQSLLSQVRVQTLVTWNEPGFKLKDLTMPEYVVGIIFGTISIILITLVSGIALGIIRIGIKRTFPGLIFDRRRSIEVIQLGLTTKPIDLTEFYRPVQKR
jgi:hypothetical protein